MATDQNSRLQHDTTGFGIAAAVAMLFNTLLVWVKETNPSLLAWMKTVTPHHWITHGIMVVGLFLILGWLLSNMKLARRMSGRTLALLILVATVAAGLGIFGFYLKELLGY